MKNCKRAARKFFSVKRIPRWKSRWIVAKVKQEREIKLNSRFLKSEMFFSGTFQLFNLWSFSWTKFHRESERWMKRSWVELIKSISSKCFCNSKGTWSLAKSEPANPFTDQRVSLILQESRLVRKINFPAVFPLHIAICSLRLMIASEILIIKLFVRVCWSVGLG